MWVLLIAVLRFCRGVELRLHNLIQNDNLCFEQAQYPSLIEVLVYLFYFMDSDWAVLALFTGEKCHPCRWKSCKMSFYAKNPKHETAKKKQQLEFSPYY